MPYLNKSITSGVKLGSSGLTSALPVIGAGLDFLSGVAGSFFNANQAKKNRQFQERMYKQQLEDNINLWKMQNEYNLPSNVYRREMQGLEANGLNPYLMYSNGASGLTAATPQGASAPSGSAASGDMKTQFGQAAAQAALINAQIRNIDADTAQKQATTANTEQSTQSLNLQYQFDKDTFHIRKLMEYGQYDRTLAETASLSNGIFNSNRVTTATIANLDYVNHFMVKRYHLDEWKAGQDVLGMWENIQIGKQNVAIGWKNAAAAWLGALSAAKVSDAQAGLLATQSYQIRQLLPFIKRSYKLQNSNAEISNFRNALGIFTDVMNMKSTQAQIFKTNIESYILQQQASTGLGLGSGMFQQFLALPVISTSNLLNKWFPLN